MLFLGFKHMLGLVVHHGYQGTELSVECLVVIT